MIPDTRVSALASEKPERARTLTALTTWDSAWRDPKRSGATWTCTREQNTRALEIPAKRVGCGHISSAYVTTCTWRPHPGQVRRRRCSTSTLLRAAVHRLGRSTWHEVTHPGTQQAATDPTLSSLARPNLLPSGLLSRRRRDSASSAAASQTAVYGRLGQLPMCSASIRVPLFQSKGRQNTDGIHSRPSVTPSQVANSSKYSGDRCEKSKKQKSRTNDDWNATLS